MKLIKKFFNRKFFKQKAPNAFKKTYSSINKSNSYREYCKRVHKRDLRLLNTMSSQQLDLLEKSIKEIAPKTLLDIGCGNGELTQSLSDQYSLSSTGIDFSLTSRSSKNVKYSEEDHETFKIDKKFDLIISIDSFYMIGNYKKFIKNLISHLSENGKILIFLTLVDNSFQASKLNNVLSKLDVNFSFKDLTRDDLDFWKHSSLVLEEMNQAFVDEDHYSLWNIKNKEALKNLELHSRNRIQRILLEISKE